jgi:hypothetical protein
MSPSCWRSEAFEMDARCIWRWGQAPELNKHCRSRLKRTNRSYRVDETYIKVKGQDHRPVKKTNLTGQGLRVFSKCVANSRRHRNNFIAMLFAIADDVHCLISTNRVQCAFGGSKPLAGHDTLLHEAMIRLEMVIQRGRSSTSAIPRTV